MFDLNITLLIQLVNFVITLVVLNYLLIRPIRAIVRKRREIASGMIADAETFTSDAAVKLTAYEEALARAREEGAAARDSFRNRAAAQETAILETAHQEAVQLLEDARENAARTVSESSADLESRVPKLAELAVARLVGKSKRPSAA